jgi:uncharacterized protein YerC
MTKPLPLPLKELLQRIEAKTEKTETCWLWQGRCSGTTPILYVDGIPIAPRRILLIESGIEIPEGCRVWPKNEACKQLICIRPEHMHVAKGVWPSSVQKFRNPRQYSAELIHQACELYYSGKTQRQVAEITGVEYSMVSRIVRGLRHGDVTKLPRSPGKVFVSRMRTANSGEKSHLSKITEEKALKILELAADGKSPQAIGEAVGCSIRIVWHVLNGDAWRWLTKMDVPVSEHIDPKTRDGRFRPIGENHHRSSLTVEKVQAIVSLWNAGQSGTIIAQKVKTTRNAVYGVVHGYSWAWLTGISPEEYGNGDHWDSLSMPEYVTKAKSLANQGMTYTQIASVLGKSVGTISRIVRGITWSSRSITDPHQATDDTLVYQHWKGGKAS